MLTPNNGGDGGRSEAAARTLASAMRSPCGRSWARSDAADIRPLRELPRKPTTPPSRRITPVGIHLEARLRLDGRERTQQM